MVFISLILKFLQAREIHSSGAMFSFFFFVSCLFYDLTNFYAFVIPVQLRF